MARGAALTVDHTWRLAQRWYAGRLDYGWTPRTPEAIECVFAEVGLSGEFWRVK